VTIICGIENLVSYAPELSHVESADIELVVDYRPWLIPHWLASHMKPWEGAFRYVGQFQSDGKVRWERQPKLTREQIAEMAKQP